METRKARYAGNEVTVLESSGTTSKILTDPTDEFSYVWVKTDKLHFLKAKAAASAAPVETAAPEHGDVIAAALATPAPVEPEAPAVPNYSAFVAELRAAGYTLYYRCKESLVEQGEVNYQAWSGETLPAESIYLRNGKGMNNISHWRLRANLPAGTAYPFPVAPLGTTGNKKHAPQGILYPNGSVEVNFDEIIEKLVRAGLQATASRRSN